MRIITGLYKGRIITKSVPAGVRPTTDQARETIFNILSGQIEWENAHVLDLCAGTGALGFEALSRGALFCDFVEINRVTSLQIEKTAQLFNIDTNQYKVHTIDCLAFLRKIESSQQFTIIFIDPPYHCKLINLIFSSIEAMSAVSDSGIIVAEHDLREVIIQSQWLSLFSTRKFGETVVDFFRFQRQ